MTNSVFSAVKPTVPVRRIPAVLEAVPWLPGDNVVGVSEVVCGVGCCPPVRGLIHTLEGDMYIQPGYGVVTGVDGEQWGVRPDIFLKTYELLRWCPRRADGCKELSGHKSIFIPHTFDDQEADEVWREVTGRA